jgi:probable poly-beta-1,6-N-acetyl-D-glucosamine export protein
MKRLLILNGISAFMVVTNHSAIYGINALLSWRYGSGAEPHFESIGTLQYNILFTIHHIAEFAIPAFLFVSGYFIAFIAKSSTPGLIWDYAKSRIKKLIVPYMIWSFITNVILLRRIPPTINEILSMYYFIPLVVQYYLLSPLIIRLAQKRWLLLLVITAVFQFSTDVIRLLQLLNIDFPGFNLFISFARVWLFPGRILYFSIGVVAGVYQQEFSEWVKKFRWYIFAVMLISLALSFIEYAWVSRVTGIEGLTGFRGVTKILFSISLILCYFGFDNLKLPYQNWLSELGGKSLAIYLIHTPAIYTIASLMYYFSPWVLSYQILYQSILIVTGLSVPLLMMASFRKPLVRKFYPLIYG